MNNKKEKIIQIPEIETKEKTVSNALKEQGRIIMERSKEANETPYNKIEKKRDEFLANANRGKIIAIWGDNGITSLATVLAGELAKTSQVLIIDMNKVLPANCLWHINNPVPRTKSVGELLKSTEINSSNISRFFAIDEKQQSNVATLGYCDGDNIVNTNEKAPYNLYVQLLKSAQSIVDYVIVVCSKELSEMMNLAALQFSDYQIFALTPDARGINFYKSNIPLLANEQFNNAKRFYVTNLTTSHNDSVSFGDVIGCEMVAKIPTDDGIRKAIALGNYLCANKYVGHNYHKEIGKIISVIAK